MLAAHRRRSAVAEALAHNLQDFFQQVEAAPPGGAEGVLVVRPVANPPDSVVRASVRKQPITGTQQMLSPGWSLDGLGVGTDEHYVFSLVFPHNRNCVTRVSIACEAWGWTHP